MKTREQKIEVDGLKKKLREEREKLSEKKIKYLKQLQHLKDQLNKREHLGEGFEYFEVEHFDLTEDMTEEGKVAAELKIADMREHFNRRMVSLRKRNLELEKMVKKYETIAALQASEMNVQTMMRKLAAITQKPQEIWDAIERQFGSGFMTEVIKQEYDVSSGSSGAQIEHRMKSQLLRYENEAEKKLDAVSQKLGLELEKVREQLKQKEEEYSKLSKEVGEMVRIAKTEAYYKCDEKWRAKTEEMYRDFDQEKNDLYQQIRDMQTPVELEKTEVKMLFNRWVFVARLQRLYEEQAERDKLLRKTKEFLNKQQAQKIAALMEQLQEYKGENYTLNRRLADAQLELVATRRRYDLKALQGQDQSEEIANLRDALQELEHRAKENEIERHELRNAFNSSQAYIEGLEQDVHDIQQQVSHFQLSNPQFKILSQDVLTKSKAARLTMQVASKAIHSLHKQQHFVSTTTTRDKGTLTKLAGLDYHFDLKYMLLKIPTVNVETQVQEETNSVQIQTLNTQKKPAELRDREVQTDVSGNLPPKKPMSGRSSNRPKSREPPSKSVIQEREELKRKREERRQNWEEKRMRVSSAFRATLDTLDNKDETKAHIRGSTSETERSGSDGEIVSENRQPIKLETVFWDVFGGMIEECQIMRLESKYRRLLKYGKGGAYRRSKSDSRLIPAKIKELRAVLDQVSQEEIQDIIKKGAELTNVNVQRYYEKEKIYPRIKVMLSPDKRERRNQEDTNDSPAFLTGLGLAESGEVKIQESRKPSPDEERDLKEERGEVKIPRQNRSVANRRPVFRIVPFGIEYIDKLLERQYAKQSDKEIQTEDERSEGMKKIFTTRRGSALRKLSEISKQLARRSTSSEKNKEDHQGTPRSSRPLKTIFKKLKRGKRNQGQLHQQMSGDSSIITAPRLAPPTAPSSQTNLQDYPSQEYYNMKTKRTGRMLNKRKIIVQHSTPNTPRKQAYQNITISNFVMNINPPPLSSISQQNSRRNLKTQQLLEVIPTETSVDERPYTSKPSNREHSRSVSDWNPLDLSHVSSFTIEPRQPDARENRLKFNYQINKSMRAKFRMKRASINF